MSLFHHDNARQAEQRAVMAQIERDGVCSFCPEHMPKYHKHPIEKTGAHWYVTKNAWPYNHTVHHFLIVANAHTEKFSALPHDAQNELFAMVDWLQNEYSIDHGTLMMRESKGSNTGATVVHLHAHFVVADDSGEPVITRVG